MYLCMYVFMYKGMILKDRTGHLDYFLQKSFRYRHHL